MLWMLIIVNVIQICCNCICMYEMQVIKKINLSSLFILTALLQKSDAFDLISVDTIDFNFTPTLCDQIWSQNGSDWPQMGQIRGFFRSLTHFGSKSVHPVLV